jgi:hypothetical protein
VKPRGERLRDLGGSLRGSLLKPYGSEERKLKSIEKLFGKEAVKQTLPEEGYQQAGPF